jgi:IMP dehydrogenase/GMP reductase
VKTLLTFDDVLILPRFSKINSRQEVDLSANLGGLKLKVPVLSANMDTVTDVSFAKAMAKQGGVGVLHRFEPVSKTLQNLKAQASFPVMASFGLGDDELDRFTQLADSGITYFVLDVAHGAQLQVVQQYAEAKRRRPYTWIMVGNFATITSIKSFENHLPSSVGLDAIKVGIGPGSACLTRVKTGVGVPQLSAILEISQARLSCPIVADGGMRTPGDIAKALAAGADAVMLGGMLAGTDESPKINGQNVYRGSASLEAYEAQGKSSGWRTAEGDSFVVSPKGSLASVLHDIEGGLRSAFSYVGAYNLKDFWQKAELIQVTPAGAKESKAHGKDGN